MTATETFRTARDFLLEHRDDPERAYADFRWPELPEFNWALDWFDGVLAAERPDQTALWLVTAAGEERMTFAELSHRSTQVAGWLREQEVRRGDRVLLMLGNVAPLWELTLAAAKIGAVIIPATTLLGPADLADRIERGQVSFVVAASADTGRFADVPGDYTRIAVGEPVQGWLRYSDSETSLEHFEPDEPTRGSDPLLLYFTSGTTARPKLVMHTHVSYPVGHLSTMYWIGLRPGDVHLNVSSPGWAKHAWSCLFAPWNAAATVLVHDTGRFSAPALLDTLVRCEVDSFCAPPTVWRMLVQEDLTSWPVSARELVSAGEPLNPEVIEHVRSVWGTTVRDGYGQTETTAQIGNPPGTDVVVGSMGRPLPGYPVVLVDPVSGGVAEEGEICLALDRRPAGLMTGYWDGTGKVADACPTATTTPVTWPAGPSRARSRTSGGPTTCSRPRTTGSPRSSWRACWSSTRRWRRRRSCRRRTGCGSRCPRRTWCWPPAGSRRRRPRNGSCGTAGRGWRRTSGSGGSSSASCRRRSPARSAGSSCARPRRRPAPAGPASTARRTSPTCAPSPPPASDAPAPRVTAPPRE